MASQVYGLTKSMWNNFSFLFFFFYDITIETFNIQRYCSITNYDYWRWETATKRFELPSLGNTFILLSLSKLWSFSLNWLQHVNSCRWCCAWSWQIVVWARELAFGLDYVRLAAQLCLQPRGDDGKKNVKKETQLRARLRAECNSWGFKVSTQ